MTMNFLRSKTGRVIHASNDARVTMCNKPCDGWVPESGPATCKRCLHVALERG